VINQIRDDKKIYDPFTIRGIMDDRNYSIKIKIKRVSKSKD